MIELTREQLLAIAGKAPPRVHDPDTNTTYVLVKEEAYERFRALLAGDDKWGQHAYLASLEVLARDGWDDPRMDAYDLP